MRATPVADPTFINTNGNVNVDGAGNGLAVGAASPGYEATYQNAIVNLGPTGGTGVAPRIDPGTTDQAASGAQIKLPVVADGTALQATWRPGDQLVATLPAGVTFASAPTVTASGLVDLQNANALAGFDAKTGLTTTATALTALQANGMKDTAAPTAAAVALSAPTVGTSLSADGKTLTITFTNNEWGTPNTTGNLAEFNATSKALSVGPTYNTKATNDGATWTGPAVGAVPGFLLSLSNVKLSVAAGTLGGAAALTIRGNQSNGLYGATGYAVSPAVAAVTPGPASAAYVGGATTIAWVTPGAVTVADQALVPSTNLQSLSDVTLSELVPNGWANGTFKLSGVITKPGGTTELAEFETPAHTPAITDIDATATSDSGLTAKDFVPNTSKYTTGETTTSVSFTLGGADDSKIQALTVKGLRITNNVPGNSKLALTLTPTIPATAQLNLNQQANYPTLTANNASTFSFSPEGLTNFVASTTIPFAPQVDRYAGTDRYDTARLLSDAFLSGGTVNSIIVANGENAKQGVDALSANYLAGIAGVPIVLTQANTLPASTKQAIRNALDNGTSLTRTVYVMGAKDSVSDAVVKQITDIFASSRFDVHVVRIAGANRYETSADAATYEGTGLSAVGTASLTWGQPALKTAIIASGTVNADALAAGPIAFENRFPVLLTDGKTLAPSVQDALQSLGIKQAIVVGGTDRVSDAVVTELGKLGVSSVKRVFGADRYDTAVQLSTLARLGAGSPTAKDAGLGWNGTDAFLANRITGWPDALTAGPLAGASESALLTSGQAALPDSTAKFLTANKDGIDTVFGLGKNATIAQSVLDKANGLLG